MSVWTLDINGVTKTLAEWQLASPTLNTGNLERDTFIAQRPAAFDGIPLAAFGDPVKLYRDGVKWFEGECFIVPRSARPDAERQYYGFVGPWNFLERNSMKAPWYHAFDGTLVYTSHLLFPLATVAHHITACLQYAKDRGANLQIGTITAPVTPPGFEVTDLPIAGAIQRLANYAPDCVGWFDYSTSPPTFHFRPRSALAEVTLEMPSAEQPFGSRLEAIEPTAREDLQVDNVQIIYEQVNTEDGVQKMRFALDSYPVGTTGLEDGCLCAVVNLQGFSATTVQGSILAETIDINSLDWWRRVSPDLADARVQNLQFADSFNPAFDRVGFEGEPSLGLPRRLLDGQAAPWMENPDGTPVEWQREILARDFKYTLVIEGEQRIRNRRFKIEMTSTNAPAGETFYSTLATFEDGDPIPIGLAQYLYNALHPVQYDALFAQHKGECDGEVKVGNVVNLVGAHADWAAMRAVVQQVSCNITAGTTEITCGPPRHLTIDQILELLRVGRIRRRWTNPSTLLDGEISGREVELGRATGNNNTVASSAEFSKFEVISEAKRIDLNVVGGEEKLFLDFGSGKTLTLALSDSVWSGAPAAARALSLRAVCVRVNNVNKSMLVIGGAPFDG